MSELSVVDFERQQMSAANATGLQPVVFIHGLWLLPSSWDRWAELFEDAGFSALTPGWPESPLPTEEAHSHPELSANTTIGAVADHFELIIRDLLTKPVVIGHSLAGLISQMLAGKGVSKVTVAIGPAPLSVAPPLPMSPLKSAWPVFRNPANRNRAVPLTYEQFRFAFANAVSEEEAQKLYHRFAVPPYGSQLFEASTANLNPWTEAKVDSENPERGPLLFISGGKDNIIPWSTVQASYRIQRRNKNVTEIVQMPGRGHALIIDGRWREVAEAALAFVKRFV